MVVAVDHEFGAVARQHRAQRRAIGQPLEVVASGVLVGG